MKKNLNISVTNKIAKYLQRDGAIVCGNSDYQITFTFDAEWDAYPTKTARFIWNGKYWDQPFTGNVCPVPIIQNAVFVIVGVYAGDLCTTTPASIPCKRSILCDDVEINDVNIEACREQAVSAAYRAESAAAIAEAANPETQRAALEAYIEEKADAVMTESNALIAAELAKKAQLKPEMAESEEWLEENGDKTKLYVLCDPTSENDNYIFAYLGKKAEAYVNQIPRSTDTDGTIYGGDYNGDGKKDGYAENMYLSSGVPASRSGIDCSGFIPIGCGSSSSASGEQVVRMQDVTAGLNTSFRIAFYSEDEKQDKKLLQQIYGSQFDSNNFNIPIPYEIDADGNVTSFDVTAITAHWRDYNGLAETAFFRISCPNIDGNSIITVNQDINAEGGIVYEWTNTGHAFIPVDYEPRIIKAEKAIAKNATDISNLNGRAEILETEVAEIKKNGVTVPEGVQTAVSALVDKAMSREDNRILRFLISSDAHQKNEGDKSAEITAGNKELGQAHGEILKLIGVDFVANLGDITWGSSKSDSATCLEEGKAFNQLVSDKIRGETQIWTEGNHETALLTASQIHALIYSHNKGLIQDTDHWIEGYGYMDFPNQKVRVICLNTNQGTGSDVSGMSNEQLKWFAETALDMSGKTDWSVITMGHHPLSYNTVSLMRYAAETVKAFINGDNFSFETNDGFTFGLDYSNKKCQYVGHFHGHAHSFSEVKMQRYVSSGVYEEFNACEICIPNACYDRNNQYSQDEYEGEYVQRYMTPTTYYKTDEDGNRTSFNLVTVCLDKKVIYADNYGAGIDREINY